MPAAYAARVMACVVWLPPETQVQGRFFAVLPQVMSHFSHGTPEHLGADAMDVNDRLRSQVADSRLDRDPAVGLDDAADRRSQSSRQRNS